MGGRAEPAHVEVLVATPHLGHRWIPPEPAAVWLRLHTADGQDRYQRAIWHRRLVGFGLTDTVARKEQVDAHVHRAIEEAFARGQPSYDDMISLMRAAERSAEQRAPNALVRRCPGLRRMYLVDIPDVGRVWPASTARRRQPMNYGLAPVDRQRVGEVFRRGEGPFIAIPLLVMLMVMLWSLGGAAAALLAPVMLGSLWLWLGATPWRGVYAGAPESGGGSAAAGTAGWTG